jgi:ferritin-like metal-binding protein YciE
MTDTGAIMTYYENLQGMLKDAEEIRDMAKANGDLDRVALWDAKIALHRAEIASYARSASRDVAS